MSDARLKRVTRELAECRASSKTNGITVEEVNGSLENLKGTFFGPSDTPYANGLFEVAITVPPTYPFAPLKMKFITKIYHPNISSANGAICLSTLSTDWSPVFTIRTALISLQSMLAAPEPSDPQDAEVANHYLADRGGFEETARFWTEAYAKGGPSSQPEGARSPESEAALAGVSWKHVQHFSEMGFPPDQVIRVLKELQYRGAKAKQISDDQVVDLLCR